MANLEKEQANSGPRTRDLERQGAAAGLRAILPADEHGDAAAHDVEARPLLLDQTRAPAGEGRRRAPACGGGRAGGARPPADHLVPCASRPLEERVPAAAARDAPAAVVPALLGELPLLVHVELHGSICCFFFPEVCLLGRMEWWREEGWAVVKFPTLPIQLPLFISCPWCNLLSFRLVYKGNLKFPRKNYFLLWMVESMNGERAKFHSSGHEERHSLAASSGGTSSSQHHRRNPVARAESSSARDGNVVGNDSSTYSISASFQKLLVCFIQLTAKFPLVIMFLLIVLYAVPASAAVLLLYVLVTFLFALPSFLILYFAYPTLEWLVREIFT